MKIQRVKSGFTTIVLALLAFFFFCVVAVSPIHVRFALMSGAVIIAVVAMLLVFVSSFI